jgi:sRNA-binding regulator protein Hfq
MDGKKTHHAIHKHKKIKITTFVVDRIHLKTIHTTMDNYFVIIKESV